MFTNGFEELLTAIQDLRGKKLTRTFLEGVEAELPGGNISSYLIMPVQRPPRYVLLLTELLKLTPSTPGVEGEAFFEESAHEVMIL